METVGETIQIPVFIKAGSQGEASLCFSRVIVLDGRMDGSAFNIKLTILQGLVFREIFFPPREGICLDWGVAYAGSGNCLEIKYT